MTHGPEYKTNGKRPLWLKDGDGFLVKYCGLDPIFNKACSINDWSFVEYIRLPSDHWASRVIEAGLEPWAGGDEAPKDWDKSKPVLARDGRNIFSPIWWDHKNTPSDIIGYKKKESVVSEESQDCTVRIQMPNKITHISRWSWEIVKDMSASLARTELALMIEKYEQERKPKDRDEEIAEVTAKLIYDKLLVGIPMAELVSPILSAIKEAKA